MRQRPRYYFSSYSGRTLSHHAPALAVGATYPQSIRLKVVDSEAVVGGPADSSSAVSTGMRLSRQMTAFAVERGFDINAIGNIFEHFPKLEPGYAILLDQLD